MKTPDAPLKDVGRVKEMELNELEELTVDVPRLTKPLRSVSRPEREAKRTALAGPALEARVSTETVNVPYPGVCT